MIFCTASYRAFLFVSWLPLVVVYFICFLPILLCWSFCLFWMYSNLETVYLVFKEIYNSFKRDRRYDRVQSEEMGGESLEIVEGSDIAYQDTEQEAEQDPRSY